MITKKEAVRLSINHWRRMIRWAKKQDQRGYADVQLMLDDIKDDWFSAHCSLCKLGCPNCPLDEKYGNCNVRHSDNQWYNVIESLTWGAWVKNAELLLEQLKSLR